MPWYGEVVCHSFLYQRHKEHLSNVGQPNLSEPGFTLDVVWLVPKLCVNKPDVCVKGDDILIRYRWCIRHTTYFIVETFWPRLLGDLSPTQKYPSHPLLSLEMPWGTSPIINQEYRMYLATFFVFASWLCWFLHNRYHGWLCFIYFRCSYSYTCHPRAVS